MTVYNTGFATQMHRAAEYPAGPGVKTYDEAQEITYINLVAIEIALKAMLKNAGWDSSYLRKRSHDSKDLMVDVCNTEIYV